MQLAEILHAVDKNVPAQKVVERMLTMACVSHKKDAGRSVNRFSPYCECEYCTTIYTYVRAKLWFRRLDREQDWNPRSLHTELLHTAGRRLADATVRKDFMKLVCA